MPTQRWVYAASVLVVLVLPVPLYLLLVTTGAVTYPGGLPILGQLIAWMLVAGVTSDSFADRYREVVYGVAVLLYIMPYIVLSVPVDVLTQARPRVRIAALSVMAVGYVMFVWFAFPVRGVPI
jgi:hypothetical protein